MYCCAKTCLASAQFVTACLYVSPCIVQLRIVGSVFQWFCFLTSFYFQSGQDIWLFPDAVIESLPFRKGLSMALVYRLEGLRSGTRPNTFRRACQNFKFKLKVSSPTNFYVYEAC